MSDFHFGHVNRMGPCCGKPAGCTIDSAGCLYKRLKSREDPTVRCQSIGWPDARTHPDVPVNLLETWQCRLPKNPHHTVHDAEPIGVGAAPIMTLAWKPEPVSIWRKLKRRTASDANSSGRHRRC